ncbi:MAG: HPF/RaiA family ribosome-associated protein [Bacteriovoracia bacterium]
MQFPPQISFHQVNSSPSLELLIRKKIEKLEQFYSNIIGCRVVVEPSNRRHNQGNLYHVRVEVSMPGADLVVSRDPPAHQAHEDVHITVYDAFQAMTRKIEDFVRTYFRNRKRHRNRLTRARVKSLFPMEDYGFLETRDGREIYFHKNSLRDGSFENLEVGASVRFLEEQGYEGPQAAMVHLVRKT